MKTKLRRFFTAVACLAFFTACGSNQIQNTQQETHGGHAEENAEKTVAITALQRETLELKLGKVQQRNMTGTISVTGELVLPPQYEADVSAIIGGSVSKINVIEGEKVQKGEVIALLEHPDFIQMQVNLQQSSSRLAYLKQKYDRQKNLHQKGVASGKAVQKAKAKYLSTKAKVEGLKAKLRMLNLNVEKILGGKIYQTIPVISPIEGYIKSVNVSIGQYVAPGDVMFEVVNNSHIHADLMVFEKDIFKVEEGQKVYFTVSGERKYTATIYAVGKTFEKNPKAVHVHAEIEGSTESLIPGMYLEGRIAVTNQTVPALPESAVVGEGDQPFIFVKIGEESHQEEAGHEATKKSWVFKKVPVSTGLEDNGWVEVHFFEPLPDSAMIAYTDAYKLVSEMTKAQASHHH